MSTDTRTWSERMKPHRAFLILLILWHLFLGWNLSRTGQWSAWINSDAQILLTIRYWIRDGMLQPHGFLLLTQGYTPYINLFDGTDLDDHALSSSYVKKNRLVRRVYYNHYPNFFIVPLAAVSVLFNTERPLVLQLTQVFFNFLGVVFLYGFLYLLVRSRIAAGFAALSYAISNLYVDWTHSLANQPQDDFLRNAFLFLSVIEKQIQFSRRLATVGMWLAYLLLSLVSLDSMVFVFVWLVGYDLWTERKLKMGRWFLFGLAPIIARLVQFGQSLWVFGWQDTLLDWFGRWDTMANQDGRTTLLERILSVSREIRYLVGFGYDKHRIIELHLLAFGATALLLLGLFFLARREKREGTPWLKTKPVLALILLAAGSAYGLIFPGASWMRYEGRQFIPFFAVTVTLFFLGMGRTRRFALQGAFILLIPIAFITVRQTYLSYRSFVDGHPIYAFGKPEPERVAFGRAIKQRVDNRRDLVYVFDPDSRLTEFYPHPQDPNRTVYTAGFHLLYEADAHVMMFKDANRLLEDLKKIQTRTNKKTRAYLVSSDPDILTKIQEDLRASDFSESTVLPETFEAGGKWYGIKL